MLQHAALRDAGGTRCIQENEQVLRNRAFRYGTRGQRGDVRGVQDGALIGRNQRPVLRIGDEQLRGRIPDHEVQALLGIGRIQRLIGAAGLEGAEGGHGHVFAAADQDGDDVFPSETQRGDVGGDPVGHFVQFLVCQRLASIAHRRGVRPLGCLGPEQGHDGLCGVHREGIGIETVQEFLLFLVNERDAVHRTVREHPAQRLRHRIGEALHESPAVQGLVVLDKDAFGRFPAIDKDAHGEHRRLGGKVLGGNLGAAHLVGLQQAHLIGHHHLRLETEVGRDLGEGIVFVRAAFREKTVRLFEIIRHLLDTRVTREGQRIDEHTHRVGDSQVRTAVADGADIDLLAAAERAHGQERGGQEIAGGRNAQRQASLGDLPVHGDFQRGHHAGGVALLLVRQDGAGAFAACHLLLEERGRSGEFLAFLRGFLVRGIIVISIVFRVRIHAVHGGAEFRHEDVHGTAVEDQVMEIGEQVQAFARLHDFSAVQGAFAEIERLQEMGLAVREVLLRNG